MRRLVGLLVAGTLIHGAVPGYGYRFFPAVFDQVVVRSDQAIRWPEGKRNIEFRMLVNDNLPKDFDVTDASWRAIVERAIAQWNAIPTAAFRLTLDAEPLTLGSADADDGVNTIGFSDYEGFVDSWGSAFAAVRDSDEGIDGCDIEVSPWFRKNWGPSQDPLEMLHVIAIHEIGHCLGLAHTEPHPMPLWTKLPVTADPFFRPDPVMSYSNTYGPVVTPDEVAGVSLLYPAAGYIESRASVEGRVTRDGNPVAFGYVLAVPADGSAPDAEMGPGVFTDRDGNFLLEGLPPGDWMLWVHPFLIVRRLAHGGMLERAMETGSRNFPDQLRWIRVEAGERRTGLDIRVRAP